MGMYGLMRTFDICVVSLWDDHPPKWMKSGKPVPIPTKLQGRTLYAIDLLTSVRGMSWLRDTAWDWSPPYILTARRPKMTKLAWLTKRLTSLIIQHIAFDLFDTIHSTHHWSTHEQYPVTSLPILNQLVYSFCVCAETALSITIPAHIYSMYATIKLLLLLPILNMLQRLDSLFALAPTSAHGPLCSTIRFNLHRSGISGHIVGTTYLDSLSIVLQQLCYFSSRRRILSHWPENCLERPSYLGSRLHFTSSSSIAPIIRCNTPLHLKETTGYRLRLFDAS